MSSELCPTKHFSIKKEKYVIGTNIMLIKQKNNMKNNFILQRAEILVPKKEQTLNK